MASAGLVRHEELDGSPEPLAIHEPLGVTDPTAWKRGAA
jgi:hypothetical protein